MSLFHLIAVFLGFGFLSCVYIGDIGILVGICDIVVCMLIPLQSVPQNICFDLPPLLLMITLILINIPYIYGTISSFFKH